MAATYEEIKAWFDEGVQKKATHLIVVCDTYDYDDYPKYVMPGEDVKAKIAEVRGQNMTKIMEVYNLRKPWPTATGLVWDES